MSQQKTSPVVGEVRQSLIFLALRESDLAPVGHGLPGFVGPIPPPLSIRVVFSCERILRGAASTVKNPEVSEGRRAQSAFLRAVGRAVCPQRAESTRDEPV